MVMHEDNDNEAPVEVPFDQNSHIFRPELNKVVNNASAKSATSAHQDRSSGKKVKKLRMKSRTMENSYMFGSEDNSSNITEMSAEDLLELKRVYKQCKSMLRKIESKYGHLLDTDSSDSSSITNEPSEKRRRLTEDVEESECQCSLNKKIVFDEDGTEVMIDALPENHICPTKLMVHRNHSVVMQSVNKNIQVEFHNKDAELSENLQELQQILQKSDIETTYRNQVINKLRILKQEHLNELKFNKHSLIDKIKLNPDEVFDFKGANLSGLPGYMI